MKLDKMFSHWRQIRTGLLETIDMFSDEELTYCPFESGWPAGRIMRHIANAEAGWLHYVAERESDSWPADYDAGSYPTVTSIKSLLTGIHDQTEAFLASLDEDDLHRRVTFPELEQTFSVGWIIWHVLEHEIHHRGELSLILGLLGKQGLEV